MQTIKVDDLELSRLCLGGSKMVDMTDMEGINLISEALRQGITVFDAHHRYGNCEKLLHQMLIPEMIGTTTMTKISAYNCVQTDELIKQSIQKLGREPDIYWVSDLDNEDLYYHGEKLYEKLKAMPFKKLRIGITTESAALGRKFLLNHPECKYFMLPLYLNQERKMFDLAKEIKSLDNYIFVIKPFNDGITLIPFRPNTESHFNIMRRSFEKILKVNPDVICFGTKNVEHLKQTVAIFNEVWDEV